MPQDFSKTVLQVLQTSSVDEFNSVFKDEYDKAVRTADRTGGSVKWPSLDLLMNLAKNTLQCASLLGPLLLLNGRLSLKVAGSRIWKADIIQGRVGMSQFH